MYTNYLNTSINGSRVALANVVKTFRMFRTAIFMVLPFLVGAAISNAVAQDADYNGLMSSPLDPAPEMSREHSSPRSSLFVEYRGTAAYYSVNYETRMTDRISLRVGGSVIPALNYSVVDEQLPEFRNVLDTGKTYVGLAMVSYVQPMGFFEAEFGAGGVATSKGSIFPTTSIGARFHPFGERYLFRAGYVVSIPTGESALRGTYSVGAGIRF